jgi:3-hydroxyisobutyrate dehydrogenase-like beta-hydroxyacid dehydrogenase
LVAARAGAAAPAIQAEKDMDVALELAQEAKVPVPLAALVDQLMKGMTQEKMKALLG